MKISPYQFNTTQRLLLLLAQLGVTFYTSISSIGYPMYGSSFPLSLGIWSGVCALLWILPAFYYGWKKRPEYLRFAGIFWGSLLLYYGLLLAIGFVLKDLDHPVMRVLSFPFLLLSVFVFSAFLGLQYFWTSQSSAIQGVSVLAVLWSIFGAYAVGQVLRCVAGPDRKGNLKFTITRK